jgi:hypothetical protein
MELFSGFGLAEGVSSNEVSLFLQEKKSTENAKVITPNFAIVCIEN